MAEGRCIVCGLAAASPPSEPTLTICNATCVAEAEREIPRALGRIHQLEAWRERATQARPWHILLHPAHPSVRPDVQEAEHEIQGLQDRIRLLERTIAVWHAERAQRRGRPLDLGPRTFRRQQEQTDDDARPRRG